VPSPGFGKEDLVHSMQISYPLRSLDLWLCAQEQKNVRILKTNKEEEEVGGRSPTLG
jgi:hypothetical protein